MNNSETIVASRIAPPEKQFKRIAVAAMISALLTDVGGLGIVHAQSLPSQGTPPGTLILNVASVSYGLRDDAVSPVRDIVRKPSASLVTFVAPPPSIELGSARVGDASGSTLATFSTAMACLHAGQVTPMPAPRFVSRIGTAPQAGDPFSFHPETVLKSGDPLMIKVVDLTRNLDSRVVETLDVDVTSQSGDRERVRLVETTVDSGEFVGYIQTGQAVVTQSDCFLSVKADGKITVAYTDAGAGGAGGSTGVVSIDAAVLVDPMGRVFDTVTGGLVDGARITLIDVATGREAEVFGDDGQSSFPASLVAGQAVTDSSGVSYPFGPGQYRFPLVRPGTYRLEVVPPATYVFKSQFSYPELQSMFGQRYTLGQGSTGQPFAVADSLVVLDVPVDPTLGKLFVTKLASSATVGVGEFVRYEVSITNRDGHAVRDVDFSDHLPGGFRVRSNSFRVDGVSAKPVVKQGTLVSAPLGDMAPGQTHVISYVTEVTPLAPTGDAVNSASAQGVSAVSNVAKVTVRVHDDLLLSRTVVAGNVYEAPACSQLSFKPLGGVRILFETGDSVMTDAFGMWHTDRLSPGGHVAKVDPGSIPDGYELVMCGDGAQFAGNPGSRFLDGTPASLRRADFYLRKTQAKIDQEAKALSDLLASPAPAAVSPGAPGAPAAQSGGLQGGGSGDGPLVLDAEKAGTEAVSYHEALSQRLKPEQAIVFPPDGYTPRTTALGLAVSAPLGQSVKVFVNGRPVEASHFDGTREDKSKAAALHYWSAVEIAPGQNVITAKFFDAAAVEVGSVSKKVSFSSVIADAKFLPEKSALQADGKSPILVALRMTDEFGRPSYQGLTGTFAVDGGFTAAVDRSSGAPTQMLGRMEENSHQFTVGADGVALIKLAPSSAGGEAVVTVQLTNKTVTVRPWIAASQQDWVLVGFAEGSLAYNRLSSGLNTAGSGLEVIQNDQGRVAFYGKGTIPGGLLMTLAYDSGKRAAAPAATGAALAQGAGNGDLLAPEVFSVYGDGSSQQRDAASSRKLYVRIERDRFYAVFGDIQTGFDVTSLSSYQRTLTGVKSQFKGERLELAGFAAQAGGGLQRVELAGDGTTGAYRLASSMADQSETVTVLTRDRLQRDQVLKSQVLQRFVDYDVDYDLGTIRLKSALAPYDAEFNPNFVRIDYTALDGTGQHTVSGARVAYQVTPQLKVGGTVLAEQAPGEGGRAHLGGLDLRLDILDGLTAKAEVARSSDDLGGAGKQGRAYSLDLTAQHDGSTARLFTKRAGVDFGMSNALATDVGLDKTGGELSYRLGDASTLKVSLLSQQDLRTEATLKSSEVKLSRTFSPIVSGYLGHRFQSTTGGTNGVLAGSSPFVSGASGSGGPVGGNSGFGNDSALPVLSGSTSLGDGSSQLLLAGAQVAMTDFPARITGQTEVNPNGAGNAPSRYKVGLEYDLSPKVTLVADTEEADYSQLTVRASRLGLRFKPWTGARAQGFVGQSGSGQTNTFNQFGFDQAIKLDEHWGLDAGFSQQNSGSPAAAGASAAPQSAVAQVGDFTAYTAAIAYRNAPLVVQSRVELRTSQGQSKRSAQVDAYRSLPMGYALSGGLSAERLEQLGLPTMTAQARLGSSYRSLNGRDIWLSGLQFNAVDQDGNRARNLVLNLTQNRMVTPGIEVFLHQGLKKSLATFDGQGYRGLSYVLNGGVRYQVMGNWELGLDALHAGAPSSGVTSTGVNASVGYAVARDALMTVGYQHLRGYDRNFNFDESYVRGVYLRLRLKFDEESFHLNR